MLMFLQLIINYLILINHQRVKKTVKNKGHQQVRDQHQEEMALEGILRNFFNYFSKILIFNFLHFRSKRLVPTSGDWRVRCREILQLIWNHQDSEPFREPVDIVDHPG